MQQSLQTISILGAYLVESKNFASFYIAMHVRDLHSDLYLGYVHLCL